MDPVQLAEQAARYVILASRASDLLTPPQEAVGIHQAAGTLALHLYDATGRMFWINHAIYHGRYVLREARDAALVEKGATP